MSLKLTVIQYDILNEYRHEEDRPIPFGSLDKLMQSHMWLASNSDRTILKRFSDGSIPSTDCLSVTKCSQRLFSSYRRMISSYQIITSFLEPLSDQACAQIGLCPSCEAEAVEQYSRGRKSAWEELPELFNVGGCWDTGDNMSSDSDSE